MVGRVSAVSAPTASGAASVASATRREARRYACTGTSTWRGHDRAGPPRAEFTRRDGRLPDGMLPDVEARRQGKTEILFTAGRRAANLFRHPATHSSCSEVRRVLTGYAVPSRSATRGAPMAVPTELYRPSLALLTDLYEITMAAAAWRSGVAADEAVFTVSFRKNPFHGGFTIAAGLDPVIEHLLSYRFDESD